MVVSCGPVPRGRTEGPGGWKHTEVLFGLGQKSNTRFLTSGGKTRLSQQRQTDCKQSREGRKAPSMVQKRLEVQQDCNGGRSGGAGETRPAVRGDALHKLGLDSAGSGGRRGSVFVS